MCLYPRLIKNRKYTANKKNGGEIPTILDERTRYVPIGCQNCIECRKLKAREWQARLTEDIKTNRNGHFVTLTFSNESILELTKDIKNAEGYELDNAIATKAVRLFLERWRKENQTSVRHWLITELGHNGTENIHIHGIIWTDEKEKIKNIWKYGHVWIGQYVNNRTINYIIKYVTKIDEKHKYYKSKILTSKGIGNNYTQTSNAKLNKYKNETDTEETYRTSSGHKIGIPIYWRNKLYTEDEKEKLWIAKIDRETRYVLGQKFNTKNGYKKYHEALAIAQEKNKRLGYGTDEKDWTQIQYETQLRNMKNENRKQKAKNKDNQKHDLKTE